MWQGLSGFPRREESEYDTFGTAHSSTSISAALGMAVASRLAGVKRSVVAVIGDGAMTAGMAFEALNNAGAMDENLLVILNDNEMSISPPVGALNRYFAKLMSGQFYAAAKRAGERVLGDLARRAEEHVKGMVTPGTLFEEMGFNYIGPIDGHDLERARADAAQHEGALRAAVPARRDEERPGLQARRGRPRALSRRLEVRRRQRHRRRQERRPAHLHAGVRRLAVRHGGARQAARRDHSGHARGLGPRAIRGALSGPLLRRRHRRAARRDLRRRAGVRGREAGGRDLLHLPAARLRPADTRRADTEPADRVRDRPGGPGRRRRRDPQRKLRPRVPALPAQHDGHDALGRGRVPPDALHGVPDGYPGGGALSARHRAGRGRSGRTSSACRWARARSAARAGRSPCSRRRSRYWRSGPC